MERFATIFQLERLLARDSGSGARDKRMHSNIPDSQRLPEIVFLPDHVEGIESDAKVHGTFRIHGQDHELTMRMNGKAAGKRLEIKGQCIVPYVKWGMKDPSMLFLKVGDTVTIDVTASGDRQ